MADYCVVSRRHFIGINVNVYRKEQNWYDGGFKSNNWQTPNIMELAIRQIIMLVLGLVLAILIIIFLIDKIGSEGSITNSAFDLLKAANDSLQ